MSREVSVKWFSDPKEAEADLLREHMAMTPDQRVEETVRLMMICAGWTEHVRLARSAKHLKVA